MCDVGVCGGCSLGRPLVVIPQGARGVLCPCCQNGSCGGSGNANGNGTGSGSGNGNGNGNASDTQQTQALAIVSEVARDIEQSKDVPRLVSSGLRVASSVLSYYTTNALTSLEYPEAFAWMGTTRLHLSPLNLGHEDFEALGLAQISDAWIHVKVLGITFSSTTYQEQSFESIDNPTNGTASTQDTFVSLAGATYTIGYFSPDDLLVGTMKDNVATAPVGYATDAGNAFVHKNVVDAQGAVTGDFYGIGFTTQHTAGDSAQYQYGGPYAAQGRHATTQSLSTAAELLVRAPSRVALTLTQTTQGKDVVAATNNTYALTAANGTVFTGSKALAFQDEQSKRTDAADATVEP